MVFLSEIRENNGVSYPKKEDFLVKKDKNTRNRDYSRKIERVTFALLCVKSACSERSGRYFRVTLRYFWGSGFGRALVSQ